MLHKIARIASKELTGYFASPAALLFLAAFLGVTLFIFFWAMAFFARNLADLRPLFQWMPVTLIFLVAALTMRAWAEERRAGTLELLLTSPTSPTALVLGKFLGALLLIVIALALTLPLPVTVARIGDPDWGPVLGGYVAAIFLAAAYVAIGLWVSSRTENQIVSLIVTVAISGALYLLGSDSLTSLLGYRPGQWLREIGAGSRFASITRGVLDLRDIYYYLSLTIVFLVLNRFTLERLRWSEGASGAAHRRWIALTALLIANALAANLWLGQLTGARLDLTAGHQYTLSEATRNYLRQLREPLLIRGYFSAATHPLLAPLVPQLRDLLAEYAVAGRGRVRVEFVDPHDDPQVEAEAASRYGIRPVPFQVASKYQASVVNSYFDVLVAYGDQYQVLNFRDLIDVKQTGDDLKVELKNPEYAITSAVRKDLVSYQGGGGPFDTLREPVTFTGYLSDAAQLPDQLQQARGALLAAIAQIDQESGGRFKSHFEDPSNDAALASRLTRDYGFRPMVAGLLDPKPFWFYLMLGDGHRSEQVPLPATLDQAAFRQALLAAVKRFSPGFLKTVAVLAPGGDTGPGGASAQSYSGLRTALESQVRWSDTDLKNGQVPGDADMLMVLAPHDLDQKQQFAIDQFLMRGGTVMIASSPLEAELEQTLRAQSVKSGLEDWLGHYGLSFGKGLVLDPQSGELPIPIERDVGGVMVRELALAKYPYIVDVRGAGLDQKSAITSSLGDIELPWVSALNIDAARNKSRRVTPLLRSSSSSWQSESSNLLPDYDRYPDMGFATASGAGAQTLAVMLEGGFDSAFQGRKSPLLEATASPASTGSTAPPGSTPADNAGAAKPAPAAIESVIQHSPDSARLILIGSDSAFTDQAEGLISEALGSRYTKQVEFVQNAVDWALEDQGLLAIRSRAQFARTLEPLDRHTEQFIEFLNYAAALGALLVVWFAYRMRRRQAMLRTTLLLKEA
jgi:ABC-2 type transport system permease protein